VFFAPEMMALWLGGAQVSPAMLTTVQIMAVGSLALAVATLPYHVAIAHGHTRTSIVLNLSVMPFSLIILIVATPAYGIVGAAIPWVLSSFVSLIGLSLLIHSRYLPELSGRQFAIITVLPVAIGFTVMAGGRAMADQMTVTHMGALALAVVSGLVGLFVFWFLVNGSRGEGRSHVD
jgi:O-antigen/teichoic acid export membrane protein